MRLHINETFLHNEGVRKDNSNHYIFDNKQDMEDDIIMLTTDTSGKEKTSTGIEYYYGYEFNPKINNKQQTEFRSALKHNFNNPDVFYSEEATDFVRNGLYRMDEMKRFGTFGAVISTADHYGDETLTGMMCSLVWDEVPDDVPCYHIQLLKRMCNEVTFDEERARNALRNTKKYGKREKDVEDAITLLKNDFEKAKARGGLFKMKIYKPVVGRVGFIDFLKFANEHDQQFYETLKEGTEVLICEDFLTSGSTVNEIIRFLNTINPNTKISVFVLINQKRNY